MGAEQCVESFDKEKWIDSKQVIDQCLNQQSQYTEDQLEEIYETNHIPEEHQTLLSKFHKAYIHHLQRSKQYVETKCKISCSIGSSCKFTRDTIDANTILPSNISPKDWVHITEDHRQLYEALQKSKRRHHRFIRTDIIGRSIKKDNISNNTQRKQRGSVGNRLPAIQPPLVRKKTQQCMDAKNCEDYIQFCEIYTQINGDKEPEADDTKYKHCILYHVEDFPEQCACDKWKHSSVEMQHIIHGHWFHRNALDILQREKKTDEERKNNTPNIKYDHSISLPNELQFGEPYDLKHVSPKFKNPKQEMLHNDYRKLTKLEWNDLLSKSILYAKAREALVSRLNIKEIVALKLYTDFDELQHEFRKCFRSSEIKRQQQFFRWNKLLEAACNKSMDIITKKIYHGVNEELTLSTFSGTYYGPVSTTTRYDVARSFAGDSGKILELYPSFGRRGLKVSWLSNFPDEEEILYMNTSFQICNIYSTAIVIPSISTISTSSFERAVLEAIQSINVDSKVISLNMKNEYEDDQYHDTSGFVDLPSRTQLAVLYLLYLQYRKHEWKEFLARSNTFVRQAFSRFRDEFILLAENVKAVKMERLSKSMQIFFYTKQENYVFPISKYTDSKTIQKSTVYVAFKRHQPFRIETIIRLFPNAEQISINAKNWDFSLQNLILFLKKFDMNYADVKLQDIYIKFNHKHEIFTDNAKAQKAMNEFENMHMREQLNILRKLGWQLCSASHLHRVGFEPTPELPFVTVFIHPRHNTRLYYQSYSMQFTTQEIKGITDELEEKTMEEIDDDMTEGHKYVVVHHNPANCILSANMFHTLDYNKELLQLLECRKNGEMRSDAKSRKFVELCEKVETLVLDPMPQQLKSIFIEYPLGQYHRGITSLETIYSIFPNVKELFLKKTVLNLRMCYHLVKFEKETKSKSHLERIFFYKSRNESMKDRHVMRFKLVLNPYSWDITKYCCMLQKCHNINDESVII